MKKFKEIFKINKSEEAEIPQGKLVVYSGPSGVGKGTLREYFIDDPKYKFVFSVSNTTRQIRPGEVNGVDYNFIAKEQFEEAISNGEMLEYAEYAGNYYGTPIEFVQTELIKGNNVFLEIESLGVEQIIEKMPESITIFIKPPSIEELVKRLQSRGTEDPITIETRIKIASTELEKAETNIYKYTVVNDNVDQAAKEIREILNKELT